MGMGEETQERMLAEAQSALFGFSKEHVSALNADGDRAALEQALCFAAAAWNAMVLVEALDDPFALADLVQKVESLGPPHCGALSEALWELCARKARAYAGCLWVYRHLHVVCGPAGELRVRCEALALSDWLATGEPLRMGLVD
jgi:hypothetical protein